MLYRCPGEMVLLYFSLYYSYNSYYFLYGSGEFLYSKNFFPQHNTNIIVNSICNRHITIIKSQKKGKEAIYVDGTPARQKSSIRNTAAKKSFEKLNETKKVFWHRPKVYDYSSSIHIIYMYVPNRLQIVLLLSCYCAAILHVHQLCIRMCILTIQLPIVSRGQ